MDAANVLTVNVKFNADGSMLINGVKKSLEEIEAFTKSSTTAKDKVKEFGDSTSAMGNKVTDFGKSVAGLVVSLSAAGGALYKVAQAGIEFETKISQLAVDDFSYSPAREWEQENDERRSIIRIYLLPLFTT
jgi:hypothetical protein